MVHSSIHPNAMDLWGWVNREVAHVVPQTPEPEKKDLSRIDMAYLVIESEKARENTEKELQDLREKIKVLQNGYQVMFRFWQENLKDL